MQPSGEALTPQGHFRLPPFRVPDPQAVAERADLRLLADLFDFEGASVPDAWERWAPAETN